ncbi:MAG: beta-galactosidase small subunit [Ligilactobacillus agilis]|nr:beta-galactosidase small subunit [Ligilactobacillus agilis]
MDYTNKLHVIYDDGLFGVNGDHFQYLFSYERGSLESIKYDGKEWLYRPIYPTYWRATTDNDRGNGFNVKRAQWLGADLAPKCVGIDLTVDDRHFEQLPIAPMTNEFSNHESADVIKIGFTYETATNPTTNVQVTYEVVADGKMKVTAHFTGQKDLPQLPVFGVRLIMPTVAKYFEYDGLSGETYPDRMAGGIPGTYHVDGLPITPYLTPQEMGMHMQNSRLEIVRQQTQNNADSDQQPFAMQVTATEQPFNFSLLPYTAAELENATHVEELSLPRRSVLVIAGAVRGVGGIDSWGADVESKYHLPADRDYQFSFQISPVHD